MTTSMYPRPRRARAKGQPRALPPNAAKVLAFATEFQDLHGVFPSRAHVIEHMGWAHHASYSDVMFTLVNAGRVRIIGREPSGRGFRYFFDLVGADTAP
jgi:hypothetical protein